MKTWKGNNKLQDIFQEPYKRFPKVRLHLKCIMTVVYKWHVYMIIYMFHRIMEDLVELNF